MSPAEFRATLKQLGFAANDTHHDEGISRFARFAGVTRRTVGRWASGQLRLPQHISVLLRLMVKARISADKADRLLNHREHVPR